ncbi:alginate O-acetyltransferase AlgF [Gynuella sp.]|uniref:alginate O-acetyltransferase AlgF n=1 Tax=Gynuella sp. TaxID=2969146 RepID=UPI003D1236CF
MKVMTSIRQALSGWLLLMLISAPAFADESALYAGDAPDGSAFVRLFNASPKNVEDIDLGGKEVGDAEPMDSTQYVYLPPGNYALNSSVGQLEATLEADQYYTIVVVPDQGLTLIKDQPLGSQRKALLSFYNLLDQNDLSLKTTDGSTTVFSATGFLHSDSVEVNAIKVSLTAYLNDAPLLEAEPLSLQRGRAFSLFAVGTASQPRLVWVENEVNADL